MRTRRLMAAVGGAALCVTALAAQDTLTIIGMRPAEAQGMLLQVLGEGRVYGTPGKAAFIQAATAEARAALVTGALTWARAYTESPEFAKRYAANRTGEEPRLSMGRKWSAEEEVARRQAQLDQRIAAERRQLAAPPSPRQTPEQQQADRAFTEKRLKNMEADRARYDDPVARAEIRKPWEVEDQTYKEEHAKWEEDYPADPRAAVAKRLRDFLARSANVDFGAKLVPCKNSWQHHSCFADPAYEKKPGEWKMFYRAGKQPVEAARSFATNWLRDLEKNAGGNGSAR